MIRHDTVTREQPSAVHAFPTAAGGEGWRGVHRDLVRRIVGASIAAAAAALPAAAPAAAAGEAAAITARDLEVVGRAAAFVEPRPDERISIAVVFDPADPSSRAAAEAAEAAAAGGIGAGRFSLSARAMPAGAALDGFVVALLAPGTERIQPDVFAAAARAGVLTASTQEACGRAGYCVLWIRSQPRIDIRINRAAAAASGVAFDQVFTLMIKDF